MSATRRTAAWGLVAVSLLVLAIAVFVGLRVPDRLPAVPAEITTKAEIPGIPDARYWVSLNLEPFIHDVVAARVRERERLGLAEDDALPPTTFLAVSGGGDKGAFGAGLLCGWSDSGSRPEFKAVTGVSTGALIAPFAFLGPEYDRVLRIVYTSLGPSDVAEKRSVLAAINNDGMADNRPLWKQLSRFVDEALLKRIAEEDAKGRLLLVGTTNLDAQQPIIWNMGKIASSGAPGSLDLFRRILLASAAIPGAFPPTMIRVEVDGEDYEEMHVDGGASTQIFLYPPRMRAVASAMGEQMSREARVYVIRNAFLHPSPAPVERRTIRIAGPAIASLIQTQGLGDLVRIYLTTQKDGLDFNLAYIDDDFRVEHRADFDTAFMKALFDYGYRQGRTGYRWKKLPPLFDSEAWPNDQGLSQRQELTDRTR